MDAGIDLYAESDENFDEHFGQDVMDQSQDPGVDLYNDVLGGDSSSSTQIGKGEHEGVGLGHEADESLHGPQGSSGGRRYSLILGNLTWWTSDDDLQELMDSHGIQDLVEIRIHENRSNGQSKGFAIVTVGSEETSQYLQRELPKKDLHGQLPVCVPFSRQALNTFDAQSRKNEENRGNQGGSQGNLGNLRGGNMMDNRMGGNNMGLPRPGDNRPGLRPPMGLPGLPRMPPLPGLPRTPFNPMGMPAAMAMAMRLRQPFPAMMRPDRPMMPGMDWADPTGASMLAGMSRMPVPGLPAPHVNPAFFAANAAFAGLPSADVDLAASLNLVPGTEDYENLITQMKSVASNAIAKAAAECKTDPSGAIQKLESALLILSSSKVSDEDRILRCIKSLQEAITDVKSEKSAADATRNGDGYYRERERSRDRDSHDRGHRSERRDRDDRDRESSRRDRDRRSRSKSRDRRRSPDRRDRERDRERRDRDRDRERDRERGERRDSDRERDRHR